MQQFKYDMHVHTCEVSNCGRVSAAGVVQLHKNAGYDGVVITDHYYREYFQHLPEGKWEEKVDTFLCGYRKALEAGKRENLNVLMGLEIRFEKSLNDYLVYGVSEAFLKENPELYRLGLKKFKALAQKNNLLIFQAHPFRLGMVVSRPSLLDGVEVYNGNMRHNSHNSLALAYAKLNGLLMTSGSDFHEEEDLARGGVLFSRHVATELELVEAFRQKQVSGFVKMGKIQQMEKQ
jgi:hypothetical protein